LPCFFFVRLRARCSRTSCTFRASFSPSATCSPCFAFGQRFTRDNLSNSDVEKQSTTSASSLSSCARVARVRPCTLRYTCSLFAIFGVCSASDLSLYQTFRASFSPFTTCAPCFAFGQRFTRDNIPNSNGNNKSTALPCFFVQKMLIFCDILTFLCCYII